MQARAPLVPLDAEGQRESLPILLFDLNGKHKTGVACKTQISILLLSILTQCCQVILAVLVPLLAVLVISSGAQPVDEKKGQGTRANSNTSV